ncbi:MAG: 4Fe-4S dicluster domain-containing protein, partial [Chloroflexota bacterium]
MKIIGGSSMAMRSGTVTINAARCKGCEICVTVCPVDALQVSEQTNEWGYHYPALKAEGIC